MEFRKKEITMLTEETEITLKNAFAKFLKVKRISNLAPETIFHYERAYVKFVELYDENMMCSSISQDMVIDFIDYLKKKNDKIRQITINTYTRGLRGILYFFMDRNYMRTFKISLPRCEKNIKETYSDREIELLIEKPNPKKCTFAEFRNWTMVCYMLGTGNRLRTIINLKIGDIDLDNMEIKLKTVKNKKPYIIPMSTSLREVLTDFLKYRGGNDDDYLFCTDFGEQLVKDGISSAIRRYNHSRGVDKTSIHLFRHTFAKNWIMNGGDIFRLQKMLGHSSLDMVKEYVSIFGKDLRENLDSFNALDKYSNNIKRIKMSMKKA